MIEKGYFLEEYLKTPDGVTYYCSRDIYHENILRNLIEEKKKWCQEHYVEYKYTVVKTEILEI